MVHKIARVLQVSLAVLQFLTTSLPPFSESNIKPEVVGKLLLLDVFRQLEFSTEVDFAGTYIGGPDGYRPMTA